VLGGKKDNYLGFYTKVTGSSDWGNETITSWTLSFNDWGQVFRMTGKEAVEADRLTEMADIKIRIAYRTGVTVQMRVKDETGGVWYQIYSVSEIERGKLIELQAKNMVTT